MKSLNPQKTGDTFDVEWRLPVAFGSVLSAVESQIRDENYKIIQNLTVNALDDLDDFSRWQLFADQSDTATWPVKTLYCDIKHISVDDVVIRSDTFAIPVIRNITA